MLDPLRSYHTYRVSQVFFYFYFLLSFLAPFYHYIPRLKIMKNVIQKLILDKERK